MPTIACSHLVIATDNVPRMMHFFSVAFQLTAYFENDQFGEFVLPSRFRIAFFKPVGKAALHFRADSSRENASYGITVTNVDEMYQALNSRLDELGIKFSGPPKEHPWGEKSFLLIDPDGNRWEITQTPSTDGMLVNR